MTIAGSSSFDTMGLKGGVILLGFVAFALFSCVDGLSGGEHLLGKVVRRSMAENDTAWSKDCSRQCESEFCTVPPFLRYGKYCGLLYSGCPGEQPCDGLDACCMKHDNCVQSKNNDYLSSECSQTFLNCMAEFKNKRGKTFKGNKCHVEDVVEVITLVMEAALVAGRYLHKP
ncbi:phospholipase A2-alpha-like isoform X1 [Pyrus x bretschneideri]|uniref:phospholipase A2-alpha-like isoform X1 n=1 Tax=Pyrus x bretschneideri TaxID=225117 RepID=UPI000870B77B|nr:phospholipase A2-alpha-like isoform X1 [Pyrus x bretschneideri]